MENGTDAPFDYGSAHEFRNRFLIEFLKAQRGS
jgi:hypothetical protein